MARNYHGRERMMEKSVWSQPGIGQQKPDETYRKNCAIGSEILREACLDLFQRTANRYQIGLSDAMACHLGHHSPPRIVRSPATLCSGRLAA